MRYKGFKEYVLSAGYINTGLLNCFIASTVYVHIFPCLGALWKFKKAIVTRRISWIKLMDSAIREYIDIIVII